MGILPETTAPPSPRIPAIDLARTAALLGMILFHLVRDLELFGLAAPGTTLSGGWAIFARIVAGSFLFLSGLSLALAHARGIRWRAFLQRLAVLCLAAGAITLATYIALPEQFIFFGILHAIAVSSLLALAFLRLPAIAALLCAILILVLDQALTVQPFDSLWMKWTGLSSARRASMDFIPLVPWLAPFLIGLFCGRSFDLQRLPGPYAPSRGWRWLAWPGRHSLLVYLLHQPVLLLVLWLGTQALT